METNHTKGERYYEAQKKVAEIKKFYQHLTVYLLCNPIVIVVNLMTSPGYLWCLYSVLGWAVPIILHGMKAFNFSPIFNKDWEERKIQAILDKKNPKQKWE
ncbi:2TM domain-containing protein [Flavobacterium sp. CF108]|uniref:2TM domain-containing protein n=1 Tax=unclassified Flavobacterium TaxID=196869 RepID=UPI0008C464E8|nr:MULTISPECIES: 2TM domain-containing protein [unclassified Flavobacterium]SEN87266.1 2TM domain-containing protein [Flavobacterium sp. fv08]SHH22460.1 2TM domain-containing protein [Flavobacterium sp. CF108]